MIVVDLIDLQITSFKAEQRKLTRTETHLYELLFCLRKAKDLLSLFEHLNVQKVYKKVKKTAVSKNTVLVYPVMSG